MLMLNYTMAFFENFGFKHRNMHLREKKTKRRNTINELLSNAVRHFQNQGEFETNRSAKSRICSATIKPPVRSSGEMISRPRQL